jgi:hypothetical protein
MQALPGSSPATGPARTTTVATFYGVVVVVGFFWHAMSQDSNDLWRLDHRQSWETLLWTPLVGVGFGLVTVQLFRGLEVRMAWIGELHREVRGVLGQPGRSELVLLAGASAVGEEVLFRGAMLDEWGIVGSSLVFALVHIPPRVSLWPWTASSLVVGLAFAGLTLLTGNLGAAVAAHFVINLQNLAYITRNEPKVTLRGPIRPVAP